MQKYYLSLLVILILPLLVFGQDKMGQTDQMSMETKYKMCYNEVLNALTTGKTDVLDKYMANDFVEHDPGPMMSNKTGIARVKEDFAAYHKAFPDMKATVHAMAVSGDYLFAYLTFTGTTSEPFMGMPANQKMTMNSVDLVRFKGDKAVEHWGFTSNEDMMKMMQQEKQMGHDNMMNQGTDKK